MVNWKTSIGGIFCILCAVALIVVMLVSPVAQQQIAIVIPITVSLIGIGAALLNAKDNNVTGGTRQND